MPFSKEILLGSSGQSAGFGDPERVSQSDFESWTDQTATYSTWSYDGYTASGGNKLTLASPGGNQFKEHKLYVRKYSNYGLCIVKGYYNKEYDYENHPWIKYCRGAVIDIKNNNVICVPPEKALEKHLINIESPTFLNVPDNMKRALKFAELVVKSLLNLQ